ncbi:MAG: hypothetical protein A2Y14_04875 [Verrucomicrobia bacterium GWF2_51_19]|nr:MAG: hypothetical protein A2Y14_04875 [Verrucomicrobia bacterium GWF2_51_19]HCJ11553.1 hypothetical protein [Opitutae bacterium]
MASWENIWPFSFLKIDNKRNQYFRWESRETFLWDNSPKPLRFDGKFEDVDRDKLVPFYDLSQVYIEPPLPPKALPKKVEKKPPEEKKIVIKKKAISIPKYSESTEAENIDDINANDVMLYIEQQIPHKQQKDFIFDLPYNEGVTLPKPSEANYTRE